MIFFTLATDCPGQHDSAGAECNIRGRADVPVISSGGGMAVLL